MVFVSTGFAGLRNIRRQNSYPACFVLLTLCSFLLLPELSPLLHAQRLSLLPSIGLSTAPQDSDPICPIPIVAGHNRGYRDAGIDIGAVVPDFTLYDLDGTPFTLSEALKRKKPVLLVNGSYTCPVFREKMSLINEIVQDRRDAITIAIIYTLEAHPLTDTSVYYGYVNTSKPNYDENVLYRQPTTYGERKEIVRDMAAALEIDAPIYIDGPCNEWWEVFGPAPNNAYLIDTNGTVFAKHGWFHRNPDNILSDIAKLLGEELPVQDSTNGTFQLLLQSATIVTGPVDQTLYAYAELQNNSAGQVEIGIQRTTQAMPEGWSTALCTDICLDASVDTTSLILDPGESQLFTFYFYSGPHPDTARATVTFRNTKMPQNRYQQNFTGITEAVASGIIETEAKEENTLREGFSVFPNPAGKDARAAIVLAERTNVQLDLFGSLGRHLATLCNGQLLEAGTHTFDLPPLPSGNYFLRLRAGESQALQTLKVTE